MIRSPGRDLEPEVRKRLLGIMLARAVWPADEAGAQRLVVEASHRLDRMTVPELQSLEALAPRAPAVPFADYDPFAR